MHKAAVAGAIASIWAIAAGVSLFVAARTSIGPVVFVVSRAHAEGVHLGDLVAAGLSAAGASVATVAIVRGSRRRPF